MIHIDDVIALPQFHCKFIWLCRFLFFFFICFSIYVNNFFWNQCDNDYRINLSNALEVCFSSKKIINPFRTPRTNERNGSWYLIQLIMEKRQILFGYVWVNIFIEHRQLIILTIFEVSMDHILLFFCYK